MPGTSGGARRLVTPDSGHPASARADFASFCELNGSDGHQKTLYDYYVEAHMSAFINLKSMVMTTEQAPHKGPHFLPWHRYLLLRFEADLREVSGNPDLTLPYWDWTDCYADGDPSTCDALFERDFLGTPGSCDPEAAAVEGYLTDQGFQTNLYNADDPQQTFALEGVVCGRRHLRRQVGCQDFAPRPPNADDSAGLFERVRYDTMPYDACYADPATSFRQYLEGFDNTDTELVCIGAGCDFHGLGHNYIGGDMISNATPNDPMFFLHHAGVDRMWAAWQAANRAAGQTEHFGNPGYPERYLGPLFNWPAVQVEEMFDHEVLGYGYDALPTP